MEDSGVHCVTENTFVEMFFSLSNWAVSKPATDFDGRYKAKFGKKPTYHAACAYAAMMIVGEVAARAGGDREKIREALDTGAWPGTIMGQVKFADQGGFTNQNQLVMPVIQYQGGSANTVYPAKAAKKKAVYPFPGWK